MNYRLTLSALVDVDAEQAQTIARLVSSVLTNMGANAPRVNIRKEDDPLNGILNDLGDTARDLDTMIRAKVADMDSITADSVYLWIRIIRGILWDTASIIERQKYTRLKKCDDPEKGPCPDCNKCPVCTGAHDGGHMCALTGKAIY